MRGEFGAKVAEFHASLIHSRPVNPETPLLETCDMLVRGQNIVKAARRTPSSFLQPASIQTPTLRPVEPIHGGGRRPLSTTAAAASDHRKIDNLTVFGAGLMGAGIAQVAAMNGVKVVMTDVSEGALDNGCVFFPRDP